MCMLQIITRQRRGFYQTILPLISSPRWMAMGSDSRGGSKSPNSPFIHDEVEIPVPWSIFQKPPPWSCCLFIKKENYICCPFCGSRALPKHQKGNLPTSYVSSHYRVRAILTILLPFQVNQEVLPQYPASWRISSPLTTSKRPPIHWLPAAEGPLPLNISKMILLTFRPARGSANCCHKMIPLRAPHAIFLGKDTSAHELASISSASILVELADSEALASLVDTSLPCAGRSSKPVSFLHANAIA